MKKITSRLLTLMLSFAMVFTSIGWLGASDVSAGTGDTTLKVQVTDKMDKGIQGLDLTLECYVEDERDDNSDIFFVDEYDRKDNYTDENGCVQITLASSDTVVTDSEDGYYKLVIEGFDAEYESPTVVFGQNNGSVYIDTINGQSYSQNNDPFVLKTQKGDDPVPADAQLVDARIPEVYAGWAVDGNEVGGHLDGAVNFAAQWINAGYPDDTSGYKTKDDALKMALEDSGLDKTKPILVYDTNDSDAAVVAEFLRNEGCTDVTTANKSEELKTATLVTYPNYKLNVPAEVAKNISDNRNSPNNLSEQAADIVGGRNIRIFHAEYCAAVNYTDDVYMVDNDIDWTKASGYYGKGHVPGAEPISTDDFEPERYGDRDIIDNANEGITWKADYLLRNDDELLVLAKKYGLHKDDFVLVAGYEPMATTKIALIMKYLGIDNVYVMSGGYTEWNQKGYDLEKETINLTAEGTDISAIGNPDVIDTQDEAAAMLDNPEEYQLIDTRRVEEFEGKTSGYTYHDVAGKLPGNNVVNSPSGVGHSSSMYFYRNPDSTMRSPEVIEAMWKSQGVDTSKHMSFFCGSGWRAAEETWDAWVMGYKNASMYNDGWQGWSNAGRPFIDKDGNKVKVYASKIVPVDYEPIDFNADWDDYAIGYDDIDLAKDFVLDVRSADDYSKNHIVGSTNSEVTGADDLNTAITDKEGLDKALASAGNKRVVIVCVSGNKRAKNAMKYIEQRFEVTKEKFVYLKGGANGVISGEYKLNMGIKYDDITADDYILDVRPTEGSGTSGYVNGHLPGSVNVPVPGSNVSDETKAELLEKVKEAGDKRIVVVCIRGIGLAKSTFITFKELGVDMKNVTYLIGGASGLDPSVLVKDENEPAPTPAPAPAPTAASVKDGQTATVGGNTVQVLSATAKTAAFTKAANKKSVKVPDTVTVNGQTLAVTQVGPKAFTGKKIRTVTIGKNVKKIAKNAFKGSKATKMIVKSKKLKKSSVKGSLKGSKIKTVQVKVGKKKDNKKYVKKYKKIFTKKNAGKKAKIR